MARRSTEIPLNGSPVTLGYPGASITLDGNGKLIKASTGGKSAPLEQNFYYYNAAVGDNEVFVNRSSGAYIFRPNGTEVPIKDSLQVKVYQGPIVNEVHQRFSDWVSQVVRVSAGSEHVEFEWLVGPIPIDEKNGKEVISRFTSNIVKNNGEFMTDSNGRELLNRKLFYRPSWPITLAEKIPGNYYPITTTIAIKDSVTRFSVVPDRAQGGSSLKDGDIELIIQRRLTHDDVFGVGEALNETAFGTGLVAIGSHFVSFGNPAEVRNLVQEKVLDSWIFLSPINGMNFEQWAQSYNMEYSGLNVDLPENVQILTLEPWTGRSFLLRLEHIMESTDDPKWSKPATFDIENIFSGWTIAAVEETMLGANQKVGDSKRLIWNVEDTNDSFSSFEQPPPGDVPKISLNPMQIRTFIIHVSPK